MEENQILSEEKTDSVGTGTGTASPSAPGVQQQKYPGKKRGRKTKSQQEVEDRIRFTSHLVGTRLFKGDIKRVLKQRYQVTARTAETYISRAKKLLAKQAGKTQEQHRQDAYSFYNSLFNHPQATLRDKIWAQQRIDSLFGLEIHTIRHQGDDEKPIAHTVVSVDAMTLIEKARLIREEAERKRLERHAVKQVESQVVAEEPPKS